MFIGVDPHKLSVTFEARDSREILRATGCFPTDAGGYRLLVKYARQWPERIWAVEGANGIGRPSFSGAGITVQARLCGSFTVLRGYLQPAIDPDALR